MGRVSGQLGRIGVLMGGISSERDISLKSGRAIVDALIRQGQKAIPLDITDGNQVGIDALIRDANIDIAFIALHGRLGEDGGIQGMLEEAHVPYTGSGVEASRLAFDKVVAQDLFKKNGIPTPAYVALSRVDRSDVDAQAARVGSFPMIAKPSCEGSSIGIGIVTDKDGLMPALEEAWKYSDAVLLEKYIEGKELTVGIVGQETLPIVEIRPKAKFFDFEAKYTAGKTDYVVPAQIPEKVACDLQKTALDAHKLLGCVDFSRVDFMLDSEENYYILELNTIPGFTSTSLLPKAAEQQGMGFDQLCLKITELGYGKKKEIKDATIRH